MKFRMGKGRGMAACHCDRCENFQEVFMSHGVCRCEEEDLIEVVEKELAKVVENVNALTAALCQIRLGLNKYRDED